jgi:sugar O-acyltransferase (sialic acid O-acetyltransferase NeuD family)
MSLRQRRKRDSVAILGFHDGSAGQIAEWFERVSGCSIACYVHEAPAMEPIDVAAENRKRVSQRLEYPIEGQFKGRPFIVCVDWVKELKRRGIRKVLPLTPENRLRLRQVRRCRDMGLELVSAIHPTAVLLEQVIVEPGVWINAKALIGYKSELAAGCIVNTGAQIDHHNVLRPGCQVDPAVVTAGNVTLGECSHVHTGAVIINRKTIGSDAIVGAGAVVIEDIPPGCTAVGVPARVIRRPLKPGKRTSRSR